MQRNTIRVISALLSEISPTLDSYEADTENLDSIGNPALYDNVFAKYSTLVFNEEKYHLIDDLCDCGYSSANEYDELFIAHLKVKKLMSEQSFAEARRLLLQIMDGDVTPPRLLLYLACCDMEICCREEGDYKGAYEFAGNRLEILEHMLVDN